MILFSIIAAIGKNGEIGEKGKLPWPHLEKDIRWFRAITTAANPCKMACWSIYGQEELTRQHIHPQQHLWTTENNAVIMGRKTYLSLPSRLSNRQSIVLLSHTEDDYPTYTANSLDAALRRAEQMNAKNVFVIDRKSVV